MCGPIQGGGKGMPPMKVTGGGAVPGADATPVPAGDGTAVAGASGSQASEGVSILGGGGARAELASVLAALVQALQALTELIAGMAGGGIIGGGPAGTDGTIPPPGKGGGLGIQPPHIETDPGGAAPNSIRKP